MRGQVWTKLPMRYKAGKQYAIAMMIHRMSMAIRGIEIVGRS